MLKDDDGGRERDVSANESKDEDWSAMTMKTKITAATTWPERKFLERSKEINQWTQSF